MEYRIWAEEEREQLLARNKQDLIKSSVEVAIAAAISLVSLKVVNMLPAEEMVQRIAIALGQFGIAHYDIHAGVKLGLQLYDRTSIRDYYYTCLYGEGNERGRRKK